MEIKLKDGQAKNLYSLAEQKEQLRSTLVNLISTENAILEAILEEKGVKKEPNTVHQFKDRETIIIQEVVKESNEQAPKKKK